MSFNITIKNKEREIKFNYRLLFKANKYFGSEKEDGTKEANGAGNLFLRLTEKDDDALVDFLKLACKEKVSEEDIIQAIEEYVTASDDVETDYVGLFDEILEEMKHSGFFSVKLKQYLEMLEKARKMMLEKETKESMEQAKAMEEAINMMKKYL